MGAPNTPYLLVRTPVTRGQKIGITASTWPRPFPHVAVLSLVPAFDNGTGVELRHGDLLPLSYLFSVFSSKKISARQFLR